MAETIQIVNAETGAQERVPDYLAREGLRVIR